MSRVGQYLVILILIMSLVFMSFSMVVYSTHKNWRETAEQLQSRVSELQAQYNQKIEQYNRLDSQLQGEVEAFRQQLRKLESERVSLVDRNSAIQAELDQLKQQRREATAAVAATQENNARLTQEVEQLRTSIRENEKARDDAFALTLEATEEYHQIAGRAEKLIERNRELTEQVAGMSNVMREQGIDPATDPDAVAPRVDGFVTGLRRSGSSLYIEISIGADDGLKPKHTVEIYRNGKYLGRAEVLRTAPDRAVARVDRQFQQGSIQERDRVATRLDLS